MRVYEEGELLGIAEYQPADSSFVLRQPVKAERTYRIEARVAGKGTVWGDTRVPEEVADCHAELWFEHKGWGTPRWIARYRWKDIPGRENYPRTGFNYGSLTKTRIVFLSLDAALDAYLKSCILADWNAMPPDVEGIWTFTPTVMYSNVHGGTGIVGSCTVEVTELRVEKAVEGLYGPGKPVK